MTQVRHSLNAMQVKDPRVFILCQNNFTFWMVQSVTNLRTKFEGTLECKITGFSNEKAKKIK